VHSLWPLHDIVNTNIVWCMAYNSEVGGGVVYCAIVVQKYCNEVNKYLVKANTHPTNPSRGASPAAGFGGERPCYIRGATTRSSYRGGVYVAIVVDCGG